MNYTEEISCWFMMSKIHFIIQKNVKFTQKKKQKESTERGEVKSVWQKHKSKIREGHAGWHRTVNRVREKHLKIVLLFAGKLAIVNPVFIFQHVLLLASPLIVIIHMLSLASCLFFVYCSHTCRRNSCRQLHGKINGGVDIATNITESKISWFWWIFFKKKCFFPFFPFFHPKTMMLWGKTMNLWGITMKLLKNCVWFLWKLFSHSKS